MLALLVALTVSASPDAGCAECQVFTSPKEAFQAALLPEPLILAVGEYHELQGGPKVPSAIKRFTKDLLPLLEHRVTSLVVETWMVNGKCGTVEKQATKAVAKATERPDETEDEVTGLLDATYRMGVKNHILILDCDDYRGLMDDAGTLDAEASLLMIKRKVEEKALEAREKEEGGVPGKVLLLYGGALHNDVAPLEQWAPYSFGPALMRETNGAYLELDLLVPEYVETDEDLLKERWFKPALALAKKGQAVLVSPRANVRLLFFPYSKTKKSKAPQTK
jgi:hypothetical protein